MNTVEQIIRVLHTQAKAWRDTANKFRVVRDILGDDILPEQAASYKASIVSYRSCAMDLDKLADQIAACTVEKE